MAQTNKKVMFTLFFTILLDLIGVGILIPVLPALFNNPTDTHYVLGPTVSADHGLLILGLLIAIYPLMQFISSPILGELSDKFGRKKVLAFSLFGTALSYILFAIAIITKNIPLLFASRALDGITGGNISVAQAAIADISTPENKAKNFGLIGAAFGLGFMIGPYIGGKISDPSVLSWFDVSTPFWFAAMLSIVNVCLVLMFLKETHTEKDTTKHITISSAFKSIFKAWKYHDLRTLFVTVFLFNAGFAMYNSFSGIFLFQRYNFTQSQIGTYYGFIGICIIVAHSLLVRFFAKRYPSEKILQYSLPLVGLCLITTVTFVMPIQSYIIGPLFAAAIALTVTSVNTVISNKAGRNIQGEVLGIAASVAALAQAVTPGIGGFIASKTAYYIPLAVAALIVMCGALLYSLTHMRKLTKDPSVQS